MYRVRFLLVFLFVQFSLLFGQDDRTNFMFFGEIPQEVDAALYAKLKNVENPLGPTAIFGYYCQYSPKIDLWGFTDFLWCQNTKGNPQVGAKKSRIEVFLAAWILL